jgi:hypothetical protein
MEPNSPEWVQWFLARVGYVTASRFGDVVGTGRSGGMTQKARDYRAKLIVERLTGEPLDDGYVSADMQRGIDLEPGARAAYAFACSEPVDECGFLPLSGMAGDVQPWLIGASPDGLVGDCGTLEIKCPRPARHIQWMEDGRVPPEHYWQVLGQMWVTGRDVGIFVSYCPALPARLALWSCRVMRDEVVVDMDRMAEAVIRFEADVTAAVAALKEGVQ